MSALAAELRRHVSGELRENEPLAPRTSVRVGGPADLFVRPSGAEELRLVLAVCASRGVPVTVLGGGANTVVADGGVAGVVVRLPVADEEEAPDEAGAVFCLGAGAPIARVVQLMRERGLAGGEFLAGVPGTLGGAVAMNAGTKHGETVRVVEAVELVTAAEVRRVRRDELVFRYRCCALPAGSIVSRIWVRLSRADEAGLAASRKAMDDDLAYRRRTQPLSLPSFGSVFTNPPGDAAGRLVEAAGLKGARRGAAQISELHANFIVNHGGARAADVRGLLEDAKGAVRARFAVELHPEVKLVGRWEP